MKAALLLALPLSLPALVLWPGGHVPAGSGQGGVGRGPDDGATSAAAVSVSAAAAAVLPFGPGEEAHYQLKLGAFSVGRARLAVAGVEEVRGHPSYRLEMSTQGRYLFARVDDAYWSWMDTRTLASRRYIRDVHQVRYKSRREFEIFTLHLTGTRPGRPLPAGPGAAGPAATGR